MCVPAILRALFYGALVLSCSPEPTLLRKRVSRRVALPLKVVLRKSTKAKRGEDEPGRRGSDASRGREWPTTAGLGRGTSSERSAASARSAHPIYLYVCDYIH